MVLAEVPLWVVHTTASGGGTNGILGSSSGPDSNSIQKFSTLERLNKMDRARNSLSLLAEGMGGVQKCAIYSIDIHPSGQKFATGGGDGTVRLWNSSELFISQQQLRERKRGSYGPKGTYESSGESSVEEDGKNGGNKSDTEGGADDNEEQDETMEEDVVHDLSSFVRRKDGTSSPHKQHPLSNENGNHVTTSTTHQTKHGKIRHRLLCTMSAHTGSSVLAVRFSSNGQYLASAGDDAVVCIYAPSTKNASGNLDHTSVEHWSRIKLCRGHGLDAVGLAWAPDDSHLVSCSLDSNAPIIVWKLTDLAVGQRPTHANVLCNPYKILGKGVHTSTVKGVTFDPAGTYLASSGDDPSVCVWRAYDDWGLERRVDASAGIFRRWKEGDAQALSSQTLFRRLSWATDGAYICSTNSVVKNKHVASTISREGWGVSSAKSVASGAAHLVGHKQPVVVSRHSPFLLDAKKEGEQVYEDDPEYATLLALGDKRGFVTVWSTRQSRPVFKLQCSENRCTVTDLSWGRRQGGLVLLVSLLDGQVVALLFGVPSELGNVLKPKEQARVFQLRYGIDINDGERGIRRLFVGENSGPRLIENALQYTLEDRDGDDDEGGSANESSDDDRPREARDWKDGQSQSTGKGGKKRIRPVLMRVDDDNNTKKGKPAQIGGEKKTARRKSLDPLQDAMEGAQKAASGAEAVASQKTRQESGGEGSTSEKPQEDHPAGMNSPQNTTQRHTPVQSPTTPQIPHSTDRVHSVELPLLQNVTSTSVGGASGVGGKGTAGYVADCTNSIQVPARSSGGALPCTMLTISCNGQAMWKDQLPGTSCSALAASMQLLVVGTCDGCVHLYGTSPTLGWASGASFRSHPPFVFGSPIVALKLHEKQANNGDTDIDMLVVDGGGKFGVYNVVPDLRIRYKGSILAPMTHMSLSADMSNEIHLPKLARIQITDTKRLLLILSLHSPQGRSTSHHNSDDNPDSHSARNHHHHGRNMADPSVGAGGSLQAFVYNKSAELWIRVADSRFVLSDFYSTLPSFASTARKDKGTRSRRGVPTGELAGYDDMVRMGATASNLRPSRRGSRSKPGHADAAYHQAVEETGDDVPTRSHCEDRMACAAALGSPSEFEQWLSKYVQTLSLSGNEPLLRLLVDRLLSRRRDDSKDDGERSADAMEVEVGNHPLPHASVEFSNCWWLSGASEVLGLDRAKLVQSVVIPEMSRNRALQRLTNEIAIEVDSL